MGNPHEKLKYIHVAGTNGKGSTVAFISNILMRSGYKVGIYTSPYLERFTERIRIDEIEIGKDELARITAHVKEKVEDMILLGENHPTEFEIVTAIAFQYYFEKNCDIVVLEVGMGGRLDSTNVISTPLVSVITTISYDHMEWLGESLHEIAFEKAGIIKDRGDVVLYPQSDEVEKVFEDVCRERNARLYKVDMKSLKLTEYGVNGQTFDFEEFESLRISLLGEHQLRNCAVAIKCVRVLQKSGFDISEAEIAEGLAKTKWPGRLEVLCAEPIVIIDGGHNAECAEILKKTLNEYFPCKRKTIIMGVMKDKDYKSMIQAVASIASCFITVTPKGERSLPAKELEIFVSPYCNYVYTSDTIEDAIRHALEITPKNDLICAFGSFVYIGEVRKYFNKEN